MIFELANLSGQRLPLTREQMSAIVERCQLTGELSLSYVTCEQMQSLIAQFLPGHGPADVLSFPDDEGGGEIVLCPHEIQAEARRHSIPYKVRLSHLLVHGLVHLEGHDHQNEAQAQQMYRREAQFWQQIRHQLGLAWVFDTQYNYRREAWEDEQ